MTAGALTLHYLDTLLQRPQKEKEQFFSDLPAVLGNRFNWNNVPKDMSLFLHCRVIF